MTRKEALQELLVKVKAGEWGWMSREGAELPPIAYDAYNGSLDASISLFEAVLPGWGYEVWRDDGNAMVQVWPFEDVFYCGVNASPSRALLIAILEALVALEDG